MEITRKQYHLIADVFPKQRGNVKVSNIDALNGMLYVLKYGCKWRGLPKRFGNWYTIYMRMSRWTHNGVLKRVFQQRANLEVLGLDSTSVKVHPDGTGALKKRGPQAVGRSRGGLTTKIHLVATDARTAVGYTLSPDQDHDAPGGRELLQKVTEKDNQV